MSASIVSRLALLRSSKLVLQVRSSLSAAAATIPLPEAANSPNKVYPEKITTIVDQIAQLNLLEVADLNECLKKRLNISDAPVMMAGNFGAPMAGGAAAEEAAEEESSPAAVQTSFTLKLDSFDAGKKVALIKEIKGNVEGMNLVQAKKFVESAPAIVKADLSKDEAEKLKKVLEEAGATCSID